MTFTITIILVEIIILLEMLTLSFSQLKDLNSSRILVSITVWMNIIVITMHINYHRSIKEYEMELNKVWEDTLISSKIQKVKQFFWIIKIIQFKKANFATLPIFFKLSVYTFYFKRDNSKL